MVPNTRGGIDLPCQQDRNRSGQRTRRGDISRLAGGNQ